jgi:uncharacterized protein YacL (UPF0231 family)
MAKKIDKTADLTPDRTNANKGTQRGRGMVEASLRETGAGRSILADKNGQVIAGNKTLEAWVDIGGEIVTVRTNGEKLVVVQREDLDLSDDTGMARKLAYYDNRAGEVGLEWDTEQLLADLNAGVDLLDLFRQDELDELLGNITPEGEMQGVAPLAESIYSQEQIIDAAFTWFRANGFPYRNLAPHVSMQEINKLLTTEPDKLRNSNTAYHVADTYHPHRFHATAEGMKSPFTAFNDDKLIRRALTQEIEWGSIGTFINHIDTVSGTQAASNFRPGFAAHLYRRFCPTNATVLDTSTGYGGRLVGFVGSGIDGFYIGIDPNVDTHNGNLRMAQELGFADRIELYNLPAEDVPHEAVAGRCDFAFTSPPYFRKEHYSEDDTQSWKRYPTGDAWRDGFLVPMMALQYAALKPGCTAIVNIADVKIKSKTYPLVEWTIEAGKQAGFEFIRKEEFPLTRRFGAGMDDEVATEPVLVFRKCEG